MSPPAIVPSLLENEDRSHFGGLSRFGVHPRKFEKKEVGSAIFSFAFPYSSE